MAYRFQPQTPYGGPVAPGGPDAFAARAGAGHHGARPLRHRARGVALPRSSPYGLGLVAMIVGFILLLSINAARRNEALSLLLFYAFTFCEGVGIAPVIGQYVHAFGPGRRRQRGVDDRPGHVRAGARSSMRPASTCAASKASS